MINFISNKVDLEESEVYKVSTTKELLKWLKDKKEFQVDCETEWDSESKKIANPYEHKMLYLQIGDTNTQWVIDQGIDLKFLQVYFEDPKITKLFVNAFFDLRFLCHLGFNTQGVYDCFLAERIMTLGKKMPEGWLGFKQMAKRYLDLDVDKTIRENLESASLEDVIKYSALDVQPLQLIRDLQMIDIKRDNLQECLRLENDFIPILAKISYKGFKLDHVKWQDISDSNKKLLFEYQCKLNNWLINENHQEYFDTILDDQNNCSYNFSINWNSSKQVTKLFKKIGVNCTVRDKIKGGTKDSVAEGQLLKQKSKFEILGIYLKYKAIKKELSTYGEKFLKGHLNLVSKRIHSEFYPLLETGRISSSKPNLQNISATNDEGEINPLRECFIPDQFNELIIADYSGQEQVILADVTQDPYLLDCFLKGDGDTHSMVGSILSEYLLGEKIEVSKKNDPLVPHLKQKIRYISKQLNFKMAYGGTAFTLKDDLNVTQEEAQKIIDVINNSMKVKQEWGAKQGEFIKKNGYIITDKVTNRRSYFNEYQEYLELQKIPYSQRTKAQYSRAGKLGGQIERMGLNVPIQGAASGVTKLACILFEKNLEIQNLSDTCFIVNLIHDEIVVECNLLYTEAVSKILEESMIKAGGYFCKTVPMKVDICIKENWNKI